MGYAYFLSDIHSYSYAIRRHPIYKFSNCFRKLFFDAIHLTLGLCLSVSRAYSSAENSRIESEGRTDHSCVPTDLRESKDLLQTETAGRAGRTGLLVRVDLRLIEQSAAFVSGANCLQQW